MSLDQDGLDDKTQKKKDHGTGVETSPSRLDLKQRELDHHYEMAESKRRIGLPLSDKDRTAIQSQQVVNELSRELQQQQQRRRPIFERRKKKKSE